MRRTFARGHVHVRARARPERRKEILNFTTVLHCSSCKIDVTCLERRASRMARAMIVALLLLASASSVGGVERIGVCFTRNQIYVGALANATTADDKRAAKVRRNLRQHLASTIQSAASLKRAAPAIPVCLFTNAPPAEVRAAAIATTGARVFDAVYPDSWASSALAQRLGGAPSRKMASRLGRLRNLRDAPYDLTLFVDDDTYFFGAGPRARARPRNLEP